MAIFGVLPANSFFAYLPIRTPAVKLFVAKSASTAVGGFGAVSRAITSTPFARAFLIAGITESLLGVIRIPFTPALTMFSIAVIWVAASPSILPAADSRVTPSAFACLLAPSFILTKNGFVSVFVIRPTLIDTVCCTGAVGRALLQPTNRARLTAATPVTLTTQRELRISLPSRGHLCPKSTTASWYFMVSVTQGLEALTCPDTGVKWLAASESA